MLRTSSHCQTQLQKHQALLACRTFRAAWHHMAAHYHMIHTNQHSNIQHSPAGMWPGTFKH